MVVRTPSNRARRRVSTRTLARESSERSDIARISSRARARYLQVRGDEFKKRKGLPPEVAEDVVNILLEQKRLIRGAKAQSFRDALTGLYNRRFLREAMKREKRLATTHGRKYPVTVLMIDLDRFKAVNDKLGHQVGDKLLKQVARVLKGSVRDHDEVVRYGGEEFVVILRGANMKAGNAVARRIRRNLRSLEFKHPANPGNRVTASIGCDRYNPRTDNDVIKGADKALLEAKKTRDTIRGAKFNRPKEY